LAREDVKEALGVKGMRWVECDKLVHTALLGDWLVTM